ncbi:16S rRNA (cytosine(967)-C(5))-methyltransferase RsmB [Agrilactobacillus yilanensis]|uniref:16S rRNA (cytosine(967)-C(5))-methyltransferase n=1 Tax=Agrilactobacillus yilanensis TaxID=2485997 RepID=A0ABW4J8X1_9LACO|nr:16S rRNA (cytosine(967)-C(5))-methyltransferase RsmB [Agrilactobacillus yilanensis]
MTQIAKTARALAIEVLEAVFESGAYSNLKLDQVLKQHELSPQDRNLLTTIVYGVLQHKLTLDFQLQPYLKNPKKLEPWVLILLTSAVYQMHYLDRIPERAAIFESVKIAKTRGHAGIGKLVNAVLRHYQRAGWREPEIIKDPLQRYSVQYSVPLPIVKLLAQQLSATRTEQILQAINQPPKTSLRVNTAVTNQTAVIEQLAEAGITAELSTLSPVGLVAAGGHLAATELFQSGAILLQDESAQLAVPALNVQPNDQVLDACAAPGGKTTQIATALTGANGHVTALDQYPNKIKLINENAKRQQLADKITAQRLDARQVAEKFGPEHFDKILVDAPCSGIGLMRRKPEIRYRKETQDFKNLQKLQLEILAAAAKVLKIGGHLVYSTCTIVSEENEQVITQFLATHPNFELEKTDTAQNVKADRATAYLTIYPDDFNSDGFFIASLKRNN